MKTILVVDDSATIRRMVKAALTGIADTFVEASSGLNAIEQLTLHRVSLIVLDLNMPDMHGLEVLKFVRRQASYRALPVIVLTTRGDALSHDAALSAGATLYLTKPFSPGSLADHARTLLTGSSTEQSERNRVEP